MTPPLPILIELKPFTAPPAEPGTNTDLYRVKPDQAMYSWNYQVRDVAPNPAVNRTGEITDPSNFVRGRLTREWQFFWADLLAMRVYGSSFGSLDAAKRKDIAGLFTVLGNRNLFLTNRFGTDNCNNYVTGEMRSEDPVVDPLICAGSTVRVLEVRRSVSGATAGMDMARLQTFMQDETPPTVTMDLLAHDPRVLRARDIYPDGRVIDFPQLYQKFPWLDEHWVPYPYIARHECWFPLMDLEKVS